MIRVLSAADCLRCGAADWPAAVADVRDTLRRMRTGDAVMVAEAALPTGSDARAKAYALPARVGDVVGVKWALHRSDGVGSVTLLNRRDDGCPLGVLDSALLTRVRTAAVSALALETLLPHAPGEIALLGAGALAASHLDMLAALFPSVRTVHLWNRSPGRKLSSALPGCHHRTAAEAVARSDAVLCCTSATDPFLGPGAAQPGRLFVQAGYHEADFDLIDRCDAVTCDLWGDWAQSSAKSLFQMHRAGRFRRGRLAADLPAIVLDRWRPPPAACVYFSSFGLNVFDIALAARILCRAEAEGIGAVVPFG